MNYLIALVDGENGELDYHVIFAMSLEQAEQIAQKLSWVLVKGIESVEELN